MALRRLGNADVTDNVKDPYLSLKKHRFTKVVVLYSHGLADKMSNTLTQLRFEYWVVEAISFIKK